MKRKTVVLGVLALGALRLGAAGAQTTSGPPVDVAGLRLGATVDEVRQFLKSKHLAMYKEWNGALGYMDQVGGRGMQPVPNGTFVNIIAAWNPTPNAPMEAPTDAGESYVVEFTPVPGHERAASIQHTVGYTPATAITLLAFEDALAKKYGDFARSTENAVPSWPTWIFLSDGRETVFDNNSGGGSHCALGAIAGKLNVSAGLDNGSQNRVLNRGDNPVGCAAAALVTVQEFIPNNGAHLADRIVTRYTVFAESPTLAFEGGSTAARLTEDAVAGANKAAADRAKGRPGPTL